MGITFAKPPIVRFVLRAAAWLGACQECRKYPKADGSLFCSEACEESAVENQAHG